jgi:hypothetical protein
LWATLTPEVRSGFRRRVDKTAREAVLPYSGPVDAGRIAYVDPGNWLPSAACSPPQSRQACKSPLSLDMRPDNSHLDSQNNPVEHYLQIYQYFMTQ